MEKILVNKILMKCVCVYIYRERERERFVKS